MKKKEELRPDEGMARKADQEPVFPQVPRTKGYLGDTLVKLKVTSAILFAYNENPCCVKSIS